MNYINLINRSLYLFGIFFLIRKEQDFYLIPAVHSISFLVAGICSIIIIYKVFNVGSGLATSINHLAEVLANLINPKIKTKITSKYRPGDVRHCYADISKISSMLSLVALKPPQTKPLLDGCC